MWKEGQRRASVRKTSVDALQEAEPRVKQEAPDEASAYYQAVSAHRLRCRSPSDHVGRLIRRRQLERRLLSASAYALGTITFPRGRPVRAERAEQTSPAAPQEYQELLHARFDNRFLFRPRERCHL